MSFDRHALRLTERLRRLVELAATADASPDDARAADEAVAAAIERLGRLPRRSRWYEAGAGSDHLAYLAHSPIVGRLHPLAPPLRLERDGARMSGTVTFGIAYEGPPGCVHGGFVAAVLDEALGAAQSLTESPGYTGTLTVRYLQPTPIGRELRIEASVDRVEGRKIFARARLLDGTTPTAEAEGVFVTQDVTKPKTRRS